MLKVQIERNTRLLRAFLYNQLEFEQICDNTISLCNKTKEERFEELEKILKTGTYGLSSMEIFHIRTEVNNCYYFMKLAEYRDCIRNINRKLKRNEVQQKTLFCLLENKSLDPIVENKLTLINLFKEIRMLRLEEKEKQIAVIDQEINKLEKGVSERRSLSLIDQEEEAKQEKIAGLKTSKSVLLKRIETIKNSYMVSMEKQLEELLKEVEDSGIIWTKLQNQKQSKQFKINLLNKKLNINDTRDSLRQEELISDDHQYLEEWTNTLLESLPEDDIKKIEFLETIEEELVMERERLETEKDTFMDNEHDLNQKLFLRNSSELQKYKQDKYAAIRKGTCELPQKRQYQQVIERYLSGLLTKQGLQHYYVSLGEEENKDICHKIASFLNDETYITEVFGPSIWEAIEEHEKKILNLPPPKFQYHLLTDPQLRNYVAEDIIYVTTEEFTNLKKLDDFIKLTQQDSNKAEQTITPEIKNMLGSLLSQENEKDKKRESLINAMANYKILYSAGNNEVAHKFNVPMGSVNYYIQKKLKSISPAKQMLVDSINDQNNTKKGLSEEQIELAIMVKELSKRGYNNSQIAFLINTCVEDVEAKKIQIFGIQKKKK